METLNFRIGNNMGLLIMNIVHEKLLYDLDPYSALEKLTDLLPDLPDVLYYKIIKGDNVITVNTETQNFVIVKRDKNIHTEYPKIDIIKWIRDKQNNILTTSKQLYRTIKELLIKSNRYGYHIDVSLPYEHLIKFFEGNNDDILDDIIYNEDILNLELIIRVIKDFINKTQKIHNVINWFKIKYPYYFDKNDTRYQYIDTNLPINYYKLTNAFTELIKGNKIDFGEIEIEQFVKKTIEIDNELSNGITPINIKDKYDALWVAPNGDCYGLNGEIANMLHEKMSDAMLVSGIIPKEYEDFTSRYLMENGWVRIHDNWINFEGYDNVYFGKDIIHLTDEQIEKIYLHGQMHCKNTIIKVGSAQHHMSAAKFNMIDKYQYIKFFKF